MPSAPRLYQPVLLFQLIAGDHPAGSDDLCAVFAQPAECREPAIFERGIEISHETTRYRWNSFGLPAMSADSGSAACEGPGWWWHLEEMYVKVNGEMFYLWRAVDQEGKNPGELCHENPRQSCRPDLHEEGDEAPDPRKRPPLTGCSYGAAMGELGNRASDSSDR